MNCARKRIGTPSGRNELCPYTVASRFTQSGMSLRTETRMKMAYFHLTPTEYDLLKVFITHRGKILTRQMLLQTVWGAETHARTHSLHVYVAQLRQKIEPDPQHPQLILTIPGVGYHLTDGI
jgi:DNA-binding response OmpR family regulator